MQAAELKEKLLLDPTALLVELGIEYTTKRDAVLQATLHCYSIQIEADQYYIQYRILDVENYSEADLVEVYTLPTIIALLKQQKELQAA